MKSHYFGEVEKRSGFAAYISLSGKHCHKHWHQAQRNPSKITPVHCEFLTQTFPMVQRKRH